MSLKFSAILALAARLFQLFWQFLPVWPFCHPKTVNVVLILSEDSVLFSDLETVSQLVYSNGNGAKFTFVDNDNLRNFIDKTKSIPKYEEDIYYHRQNYYVLVPDSFIHRGRDDSFVGIKLHYKLEVNSVPLNKEVIVESF